MYFTQEVCTYIINYDHFAFPHILCFKFGCIIAITRSQVKFILQIESHCYPPPTPPLLPLLFSPYTVEWKISEINR